MAKESFPPERTGPRGVLDPTPVERGFDRLLSPFERFVRDQTTSSILLLVCTLAALAIASSSYHERYETLLHLPLAIRLGDSEWALSVRHWINDGLMATFFFLLGLETKRELLAGQLRDRKRAALVFLAALGGMLMPALVYLAFNLGEPTAKGWGVPVATDAAFALGALGLLGSRVPRGLFSFLAAFAIMDDVGAVAIIAFFYSDALDPHSLAVAGALVLFMALLNLVGVRRAWPYVLSGLALWVAVYSSGVHGTVAGVLAALVAPARPRIRPETFVDEARGRLRELRRVREEGSGHVLAEPKQHELIDSVRHVAKHSTTPLQRWEETMEMPVALLVVPVFALANAGVAISGQAITALATSAPALGIMLGLLVGKFVGITGMCWLGVKLGVGALPGDVSLKHVTGLAALAGMGFTMSLFVANLSYPQPEILAEAKLAILLGSFLAALIGMTVLAVVGRDEELERGSESDTAASGARVSSERGD